MTTIFLILISFLVIINIILQLRQKKPALSIGELQAALDKLQNNLKDDFRINREESSRTAKENRQELTETLLGFKSELSATLGNITSNNQSTLELVKKTVDDKLNALSSRLDENNQANRDSIAKALKEFVEEQIIKFNELKKEQQELTKSTVEALNKITEKIEQKLNSLNEQQKTDNNTMRDLLTTSLKGFEDSFSKNVDSFNNIQKEKFSELEAGQSKLVESTEKKLEEMRQTVDEKLQKTLNERLGHSFEIVGKQLERVQQGLGEMQTLAQDVGGLKKVLSNVKLRGGIGEVQLGMLLEQILAPEQYCQNVKTKSSSADLVEYAVKLPGRNEGDSIVWLPIDAKFPREVYEQLQNAFDNGDPQLIETAQRNLENAIKKMAKDIHDKYIDPPGTTDFAIMFLPFESIYAEVIRKAALTQELYKTYKVTVTGPNSLAMILNGLQMGFKTLAIQKRSSEVWGVLAAVKTEFEKFGDLMKKAQNNIQTGLNQLDDVMGKRTRAIQRKLNEVGKLSDSDSKLLLPEVGEMVYEESEE